MFTPRGISDLKLTRDEIITLINSPLTYAQDQKDLQTYIQTSGTANDMNNDSMNSNINPITYASVRDEDNTPKEHYFYAYKHKSNGLWFTTILYPTPQEAFDALLDKDPARKKLCCIVL